MRRLILIFFVFVVLGVCLALVFREDSGYVMVAFAGWQLQTSLLFAGAVVLVGLWLLLTLWRLIVVGALLPRATHRWRARRRARKARHAMYTGLRKFTEGRWARAEAEVQRLAERHEAPGINFLFAAMAAQRQGNTADRDRHLEQAAGKAGASEQAVLLTQAQLQIEQGQHTEALACLARLHELEPQHPYVLELYAEQCARSADYAKLRLLIPALYKHSGLSARRINALAAKAWRDAFVRAGEDATALDQVWHKVPKRLRQNSQVLTAYARRLHVAGGDEQAAKLIRGHLKRHWDPALTLLFGDLETRDSTGQLTTVERWLKQYGEEPELLLVAGQLCLRSQLWGRARSYFEASLKSLSRPDALMALGRLFEQLKQPDEARMAYRQGLEMRLQAAG